MVSGILREMFKQEGSKVVQLKVTFSIFLTESSQYFNMEIEKLNVFFTAF